MQPFTTLTGVAVPLLYVSPGVINGQVPFGLSGALSDVVVQNANGSSLAVRVNLVAQDPAIFSQSGDHNPPLSGDLVSIRATGLDSVSPAVQDGVPSPIAANTVLVVGAAYSGHGGEAPRQASDTEAYRAHRPLPACHD